MKDRERKVTELTQFVSWIQARIAGLRSGAERGAAAVEYGLLVALIAVAIIGAVIALGGKVSCTFSNVAGKLPTSTGATSTAVAGC